MVRAKISMPHSLPAYFAVVFAAAFTTFTAAALPLLLASSDYRHKSATEASTERKTHNHHTKCLLILHYTNTNQENIK